MKPLNLLVKMTVALPVLLATQIASANIFQPCHAQATLNAHTLSVQAIRDEGKEPFLGEVEIESIEVTPASGNTLWVNATTYSPLVTDASMRVRLDFTMNAWTCAVLPESMTVETELFD